MNRADVISQMRDDGIDITELICNGKINRCHATGRSKDKSAWYCMHANGDDVNGVYGDYSKDTRVVVKSDQEYVPQTREQRQEIDHERAVLEEAAAQKARWMWSKLCPTGSSEYAKRKGIISYGARFSKQTGSMAVPLLNCQGVIIGLQFIYPDGRKSFYPKGIGKKGSYFELRGSEEVILIAEGYATACTLREATPYTVIVAFDAYNLLPVANVMSHAFPSSKIVICGDNDAIGVKYAKKAAEAVAATWIVPEQEGKDWNDVGLKETRRQLSNEKNIRERSIG